MIPRHTRFLVAAMALFLAVTAPAALAYFQPDTAAAGSSRTTYRETRKTLQLSPIVVNGQHMPFPIALQMIKLALGRPWSSARRDRNKMVCRFEYIPGSHLQTLRCETNAEHEQAAAATQLGFFLATTVRNPHCNLYCVLAHGMAYLPVMRYVNDRWINRGALLALLGKLLPAGSSYSLRITEHGKAIAEYIVTDGKVRKVYVLESAMRARGRYARPGSDSSRGDFLAPTASGSALP